MYVVNLDQLVDAYQALKEQKNILKSKIEELSRTATTLRTLSGMEEILLQIHQIITDLEKEYNGMQQMMQVLDKASISYLNCERRIVDEYEEATLHFKKTQVGYTNLDELNGMLSTLKFK
ncbi:hypothetical protein [Anaeromicropila herbilytica]|uniref:Uncharacterized protein n=1 Tax=Anaeromicropila herbilytica TaxID=2785025 RepID=A0A7R7EJK6_9FIRM|nr:hypothetical protein [Anaeromicropila herbilytica]BCN29970.1 hypothetical protein bsdtb5_12650 [Anaeromicropila herbilytica]